MKKEKREALQAAGWNVGNAEDFLELTPEECRMVEQELEQERRLNEIRVRVGRAVREVRREKELTQDQAAKVLGTKQSRVSKIEAAADDVSLDLMLGGYFALGGTAEVVFTPAKKPGKPSRKKKVPAG